MKSCYGQNRETTDIPEIKEIKSRSQTGISIITVEVVFGVDDLDQVGKIRNKVSEVYPLLPKGSSQPFVNSDIGDVFGIVMSVTGDGFNWAKNLLQTRLRELLEVKDVANRLLRRPRRELFIVLIISSLREASPTQLLQLIQSQNIIDSGGTIELLENQLL